MTTAQIKKWFDRNPDFIPSELAPTWATPGAIHVDHIMPVQKGGGSWPHNYFLMTREENLSFSAYVTKEKEDFIGKQAAGGAFNYARWRSLVATSVINHRQYNPQLNCRLR
jgi:hypothetical protein